MFKESEQDKIYKKHEVKYCPNCRHEGMDNQAICQMDNIGEYNWGYDVYCPKCEWSGDIYPDSILFEMEDLIERLSKQK